MVALDFDSQIQLLSRIQFLTRFSSNLVQITGESGSGKTWLSERYLESWASEPTQALLLCNSNQQDPQHRAIILRQIVRDGVFDENAPLLQSLEQMLEGRELHALIVIDDAQRLSANIVAELWALVSEAQRRDNWQLNVLLFGLRGKLNKWLQKVSSNQGVKPLELEISPLTESERDMFIEVLMLNQHMDAASRRTLKKRALSLPLLPGALKGLGSQEILSMDEKKSRLPLFMGILVALLLIVGGSLVWLVFFPKTLETQLVHLPNTLAEPKGDLLIETTPITSVDPAMKVLDDTIKLEPAPKLEGMTVGRTDQNKRELVVPESVVNALIDDQKKADTQTSFSAVKITEDEIAAMNVNEKGKTQASSADLKEGISSKSNEKTPVVEPKIMPSSFVRLEVPLSNQILLAIPRTHYGLQLAALESKSAVNDFIENYSLENQVLVYETKRKGSPWFMVLFDQYPSVAEARRAESQLSQDLRNLAPWPKSFTRIHDEINLMN